MKKEKNIIEKRIFLLFIFISIIIIRFISASPADLNSDNKVNATDIQLIIRWILGIDQSNPATDMDGNGVVNVFDLVNASRLFGKIYGADSLAPTIILSSPSSNLSSGVTSTILFAKTDERATCKYLNTTGGNYTTNMTTFAITGRVSHSTTLTGLANGTLYNYYIQCQDEAGNLNSTNYNISFGVNSGGGSASSVTYLSRDVGSTAGGVNISITGTGFGGTPTVLFGSTAATNVSIVNSTLLYATAPAHSNGTINVSVAGVTGPGFEYLPVPTTTYAAWVDGATVPSDWGHTSVNVAMSTEQTRGGHTYSAKCSVTGTGYPPGKYAQLGKLFSGDSANPALYEANGIYARWYLNIPTATYNDVNRQVTGEVAGQIKQLLFRKNSGDGQPGFIMAGTGYAFGGKYFRGYADNGIINLDGLSDMATFGDGVWHEIQMWFNRDEVANTTAYKVWIDGKLKGSGNSDVMGTNVLTDAYYFDICIAYSQIDTTVTVYVDNAVLANGYIDP